VLKLLDSVLAGPGPTTSQVWRERAAIAGMFAFYLTILQTDAPNGDGRVYIRQIEENRIVWNPNHLLMQPIGLWAVRLAQTLGLTGVFGTLKLLSGASAVMTTVLFHSSVLSVSASAARRIVATGALVFSAHFLSMAIAEEFYMIQMPVVAAAFVIGIRWCADDSVRRRRRMLVAFGALTGLATAFSVNNAFLALFGGLGVAWCGRAVGDKRSAFASAAIVWAAGLAIALPIFGAAYLASPFEGNIARWLVAYQGNSDSTSGALYGIELTPSGVALSAATLVYGFATSVVLLGELGTTAESLMRGRALDFQPSIVHVAASAAVFVALAVGAVPLLNWFLRTGRRNAVAMFCAFWIAGYLAFNFLWVDTSDQFWFQLLPALWLLVTMFIGRTAADAPGRIPAWFQKPITLAAIVALLALANTVSVVVPRAFARVERKHDELMRLLKPGDLFITTGWDQLVWMTPDASSGVERVTLMELALSARGGRRELEALPQRVREHLAANGRVVVARVFDLDREPRPWEQLARLHWPRARIQELFAPFETRPIGRIATVVFREVRPGVESNP
jgi:hypothetical protein